VVTQHYTVTVTPDPENTRAVAIAWALDPSEGSMLHKLAVDRLRPNCLDWTAEVMWKTYAMLTDVETVFRSRMSELGLRPIYHPEGSARRWASLHRGDRRTPTIRVLCTRRTQTGLTAHWTTIRNVLRSLSRITTAFARPDGRRLHIRNTALRNADLTAIDHAMPIVHPAPNLRKTIV